MYRSIKQTAFRWRRKIKWDWALARSRRMMRRLDDRPIPTGDNELRLFTMARNESLRLPFFFDYYFERGVDRIFLIDNGSTDDTVEIALQRANVHVYQTRESFERYYNWMEILLQEQGIGRWCIAADLDEYLIYPHAEAISIPTLIGFLEQQGFTALRCLLLDMYAGGSVQMIAYQKGENPIQYTPFFDVQFETEERRLYNEKAMRPFNSLRFGGGMRKRLFGIDPNLTKTPLFKYGKDIYTFAGMHAIDGAQIADLQGVVLHFKYLQDFVARAIEETQRGQHAGGAALYRSIARTLQDSPTIDFCSPDSKRYQNSRQLVDLGLMKTTSAYETFCRQVEAAAKERLRD